MVNHPFKLLERVYTVLQEDKLKGQLSKGGTKKPLVFDLKDGTRRSTKEASKLPTIQITQMTPYRDKTNKLFAKIPSREGALVVNTFSSLVRNLGHCHWAEFFLPNTTT